MATAHRVAQLKIAPELAESFAKVADVVAGDRVLATMLIEIAFLCHETDGSPKALPLLDAVQKILPATRYRALLTVDQTKLLGLPGLNGAG